MDPKLFKATGEPIMDVLRPGWRERAAAQRGWWKMIEAVLVIILFCLMWIVVAPWVSGRLHAHFNPIDAASIPTPFRASGSFWTICAIWPIAGPLLCFAGIIVNVIESVFDFTRTRAEKGSEVYPELTLTAANKSLTKVTVWACLIAVPLYIAGSIGPWTAKLH